jgi:hypothetical protein
MSQLAAIRPDEWGLPLFVHVLGAIVLVGGVMTAAGALGFARGNAAMLRTGYFALLAAALPGWIVMRAGAQWLYDEEGFVGGEEPTWLAIGWLTADPGGALLLAALIVGGIGVRRLGQDRGGAGLLKTTLVISLVLLAAYIVSIWAMSAKPG